MCYDVMQNMSWRKYPLSFRLRFVVLLIFVHAWFVYFAFGVIYRSTRFVGDYNEHMRSHPSIIAFTGVFSILIYMYFGNKFFKSVLDFCRFGSLKVYLGTMILLPVFVPVILIINVLLIRSKDELY